MKLTPQQLKTNAAAMLAFAEGRPVECLNRTEPDDKWTAITHPCWDFDLCDYRPKPETKTRPWSKPEFVLTVIGWGVCIAIHWK